MHTIICEEINTLNSDLAEFKHILKLTMRQSVREILLSEISILIAKTESVKESASNLLNNKLKWSTVTTGRKKKTA
jgi:hypothetical protein